MTPRPPPRALRLSLSAPPVASRAYQALQQLLDPGLTESHEEQQGRQREAAKTSRSGTCHNRSNVPAVHIPLRLGHHDSLANISYLDLEPIYVTSAGTTRSWGISYASSSSHPSPSARIVLEVMYQVPCRFSSTNFGKTVETSEIWKMGGKWST
eukprot:768635-Hanusia_phi.AAC.2